MRRSSRTSSISPSPVLLPAAAGRRSSAALRRSPSRSWSARRASARRPRSFGTADERRSGGARHGGDAGDRAGDGAGVCAAGGRRGTELFQTPVGGGGGG